MRIEQRTIYIADDGTEFRFREDAQARDRFARLRSNFDIDVDLLAAIHRFYENEINEAINQHIENTI